MRFLGLLSALIALAACASGDCMSIAVPALVVDITDACTGTPLAGGSTVIARAAGNVDSIAVAPAARSARTVTFPEGTLKPGLYTVEVRRDPYQTWIRSDVTIRDSGYCGHVSTVYLSAELEAVP